MKQKPTPSNSKLLFQVEFNWWYLKPKYWSTWIIVVMLFWLNLLPAALVDVLGHLLGDIVRKVNSKRRRIARKNIQLCFSKYTLEGRKRMLRQAFRSQVLSALHYGLIWWGSRARLNKRIVLKGQEHIDASLAAGKSVIIMASHSAGLEAAVSAITLRYPVSGPFKMLKNPVTNYLVAKGRARFGTLMYSRDAGLRPIIKDIRSGRLMFYLPDEDLGKDRSIFVSFFGVEKATVPVLGRLAKSCNADVLPCMSCYDEASHKYIIHVLPALKDFPQGDDVVDSTRMNQAIEESISLCPGQYIWTFRFFRTRPEGEQRFY
ncbi:MAG: lipid A biosynthesis acyltransferase [Gammaproteobacteria bacterium]